MKLRFFLLSLCVLLGLVCLGACSFRRDFRAEATCTRVEGGKHLLKWEIFPKMYGEVKVFASLSPNRLLKSRYVGRAKIDANQFLVKHDQRRRVYYTLKFNNDVVLQVAERQVFLPKVHNMRDIGGYQTAANGKVCWGKVFRSGHIDSLRRWERLRLERLGVRTVIDLREEEEWSCVQTQYCNMNYIHVPIATGNKARFVRRLLSGEMENMSDPEQMIYDMIHAFVHDHTGDLRHVFSVLKKTKNYPVLIQGAAGKGRVGVVVALLMASVDVRYEEILKDYKLTNDFLHIPTEIKEGYTLPVQAQVAITHLYTAREKYLNWVFQNIKDEYGSLDNYFLQGLGLSKNDRETMANYLTYSMER